MPFILENSYQNLLQMKQKTKNFQPTKIKQKFVKHKIICVSIKNETRQQLVLKILL